MEVRKVALAAGLGGSLFVGALVGETLAENHNDTPRTELRQARRDYNRANRIQDGLFESITCEAVVLGSMDGLDRRDQLATPMEDLDAGEFDEAFDDGCGETDNITGRQVVRSYNRMQSATETLEDTKDLAVYTSHEKRNGYIIGAGVTGLVLAAGWGVAKHRSKFFRTAASILAS